jgi:hypothetical protein
LRYSNSRITRFQRWISEKEKAKPTPDGDAIAQLVSGLSSTKYTKVAAGNPVQGTRAHGTRVADEHGPWLPELMGFVSFEFDVQLYLSPRQTTSLTHQQISLSKNNTISGHFTDDPMECAFKIS